MSDKSHIEWTDATWNPTTGCTKVSEGCRHCYIDRTPAFRIGSTPKNGAPIPPRRFDSEEVGGTTGVMLHPERLDQPLRWKRPRRVFVNSLSDLFHDDIPASFIAEVFAVMAESPRHVFQVLTKRPRRMRDLLSSVEFWEGVDLAACDLPDRTDVRLLEDNPWSPRMGFTKGLPNVWLGTSVEDQKAADLRIPLLLDTPAAVRFLSCEPLLGPVDLTAVMHRDGDALWRTNVLTQEAWCDNSKSAAGYVNADDGVPPLHWVIVGGESGPKARPMHPAWARGLRDQCVIAGVPFFFKQWGEWRHTREAEDFAYEQELKLCHGEKNWDRFPRYKWETVNPDGSIKADNIPSDGTAIMQKVGKKDAGRELDGCTWDEFPAMALERTS